MGTRIKQAALYFLVVGIARLGWMMVDPIPELERRIEVLEAGCSCAAPRTSP